MVKLILLIVCLGPYWTNLLFTWMEKDGLNIYINGTFNVSDPAGNASPNNGDTYTDRVIETGGSQSDRRYVTGAFDEFVIWERALSSEEIWLYYKAATGEKKHIVLLKEPRNKGGI